MNINNVLEGITYKIKKIIKYKPILKTRNN